MPRLLQGRLSWRTAESPKHTKEQAWTWLYSTARHLCICIKFLRQWRIRFASPNRLRGVPGPPSGGFLPVASEKSGFGREKVVYTSFDDGHAGYMGLNAEPIAGMELIVMPSPESSVIPQSQRDGRVPRDEAKFRRLAHDLRRQILGGEFPAETSLPTEAQIGQAYEVSRQTVRRAFQDLVAEGLVFRVPGKGSFATPSSGRYLRQFGSVEDLMALSVDSEMQVLATLGAAVDPAAASRLRLSDDHVAKTTFLRLHHHEPFSHTSVYLPPMVRAQLGEVKELTTSGTVSQVTVIGLLDQVLDAPILDAEQSITVATAAADVAAGLGLPLDTPLLRADRMYFDTNGNPVELAVSHFHPDRYSYRVRLRRNPA